MHTTPGTLLAVEAFLQRSIGLDPHAIGRTALDRAIRAGMEACGVGHEEEFIERLTQDADEQVRFIDRVVVPESWFFRDPQVFGFIGEVAAALTTPPGSAPLRILSAPCAAGEEPYSVAIAMLEAGIDPSRFRIDAADVSRGALARAEQATYSSNAFRTDDLSFRDRWFHVAGSGFRLADTIRHQVYFFHGNVLDDAFAADHPPYDIIFCRNLLIYLTAEARGLVERTIDRLLAPDGLLVLGAAEVPTLKAPWTPASGSSVFTMRRGARPHHGRAATAPDRPWAAPAGPTGTRPLPADAGVDARPASLDRLLREAESLANAGRYAEALQLCRTGASHLPPSPRMFFLMGMLHQSIGELDRAERCLHKTLYLDADHDEALLALAVVATRRGDGRMAETYRQSAARAARRKGMS